MIYDSKNISIYFFMKPSETWIHNILFLLKATYFIEICLKNKTKSNIRSYVFSLQLMAINHKERKRGMRLNLQTQSNYCKASICIYIYIYKANLFFRWRRGLEHESGFHFSWYPETFCINWSITFHSWRINIKIQRSINPGWVIHSRLNRTSPPWQSSSNNGTKWIS